MFLGWTLWPISHSQFYTTLFWLSPNAMLSCNYQLLVFIIIIYYEFDHTQNIYMIKNIIKYWIKVIEIIIELIVKQWIYQYYLQFNQSVVYTYT